MSEAVKKLDELNAPRVPYNTGNMFNTRSVRDNSIVYGAKYSSYANNPLTSSGKPKHYNQQVHKNAGGNFDEIPSEIQDKVAQLFVEVFVKELNDEQ